MTSKTITVSIPSRLGQAETKRRLEEGMRHLRTQYAGKIASVEETWTGDRMDFKVGAMGQTIAGHLEVMQDSVRVELVLPWILAMVAEKARGFIQKQGTLMLEKK